MSITSRHCQIGRIDRPALKCTNNKGRAIRQDIGAARSRPRRQGPRTPRDAIWNELRGAVSGLRIPVAAAAIAAAPRPSRAHPRAAARGLAGGGPAAVSRATAAAPRASRDLVRGGDPAASSAAMAAPPPSCELVRGGSPVTDPRPCRRATSFATTTPPPPRVSSASATPQSSRQPSEGGGPRPSCQSSRAVHSRAMSACSRKDVRFTSNTVSPSQVGRSGR